MIVKSASTGWSTNRVKSCAVVDFYKRSFAAFTSAVNSTNGARLQQQKSPTAYRNTYTFSQLNHPLSPPLTLSHTHSHSLTPSHTLSYSLTPSHSLSLKNIRKKLQVYFVS